MKKELSILIPTFNGDCREQVMQLSEQAERIEGLRYEILVADDGSTDADIVSLNQRVIATLPHSRYILRGENTGRSAIRNFLVSEALFEWVIIMDCEMSINHDDYLLRYLKDETEAVVVYGGITVGEGSNDNLRFLYEKRAEPLHTAEKRQQNPYKDFHTANFMAKRDVLLANPFDERFHKYGYEDVLLGKQLHKNGIDVWHIDNPVGFDKFESNESFVRKTEESLETLCEFRNDLRGYSQMLTFAEGIHLGVIKGCIKLWHYLFGGLERRHLCGKHPSLKIFKLYKIGYFLSIT